MKKVHLGDKGETSTIGKRVSKTDPSISVIGSLDELNSFIGLTTSFLNDKQLKNILEKVQNDLFLLGEEVVKRNFPKPRTKFSQSDIEFLENEMEILEKEIKPLKKFVLPGGSQAASSLHVARSVCRRCEREIANLTEKEKVLIEQDVLDENVLKYVNRLSDLLFVMARLINQRLNVEEKTWGPEGLLSI